MNRSKFAGLIFMMLFSIIGIIWVQIRWIRNAVGIRNENFDFYVTSSIREAANSIESSRKMNFFDDFLFQGTASAGDTSNDITSYFSVNSYSTGGNGNISVRITNQSVTQNPGEAPVVTIHDTIYTTDSSEVIMTSPEDPGEIVIMNSNGGNMNTPHGIYIKQEEFIEWAKKRSDELRNMNDKMIAELYNWEKTTNIDREEVGFALERAFMFSPIRPSYEYAIIRDGKVEDGSFRKAGKNDFLRSKYKVRLFADNIIRKDLTLSVVFPERTTYVLGSMAWILGGSLLFSLIILATFALSLFFLIRQKKVSEMKSDFINNMTHEFKTPIATISLAADTITNPKVINDESSIKHFIGMIKKENSRMDKKVETILQIASLDKKEIHFKFENISLHDIINHAVDTIDIIIRLNNGRVMMKLDAGQPVIRGDSEHLFNLVNNLLDNAIKYSTGSPEITVETKNSRDGIILSVEDKGIGMTKSVQSKIFERFYRQASGNVHDVKGFGLGLNYVRAIVDAHRGNVTVFSEPGKGSRFDVYLPFNTENEK
ncbi:MAG: HAMP domain-containing histidine kinase [Bacteroidales bacterium]|jgi:two-component system phosphate regulon sensor histidine kinase PhoR|nr:HAMP domain-containing histidine kinase [Bacteroidales bacterium]